MVHSCNAHVRSHEHAEQAVGGQVDGGLGGPHAAQGLPLGPDHLVLLGVGAGGRDAKHGAAAAKANETDTEAVAEAMAAETITKKAVEDATNATARAGKKKKKKYSKKTSKKKKIRPKILKKKKTPLFIL